MLESEEVERRIQQLKAKLRRDPNDLVISRVPQNTLKRFHEICNVEDFCKDRGMALKYLIDFHDGVVLHPYEILIERIGMMEEELAALKAKPETKPEKIRKALSGRELGPKKGE